MKELKVSVRGLVEFLLRGGDIQTGGRLSNKKAMLEGGRIHRKLQRSMGSTYRSEVSLSYTAEYENFSVTVWGRADGIYKARGLDIIDEIKGTYSDTDKIEEPVPVHLAQARCYAFIFAFNENKEKIRVQLRYCNLKTERIKKFVFEYSFSELQEFFTNLLEEYYRWAAYLASWEEIRGESIRGLEFPFSYRPGQKELAGDVYRTILREKQLYIQAATGTGKTMSVVFPSVHSLGQGLVGRIFYITAKTVTGRVAAEAVDILRGKGLRLKSLSLTAKEKLCPCDEMICDPGHCERAKGHYDRINEVLYSVLTENDSFTREVIISAAESVCPFELQLDLADFSDMVIGDYNYVFDPEARLKRFFSENASSGDAVILIDEAHNLAGRAREMYSAQISIQDILSGKKAVKGKDRKLNLALSRVMRTLEEIGQTADGKLTQTDFNEKLELALLGCAGRIEEYLEENTQGSADSALLELYFTIRHYLAICEVFDDSYIVYVSVPGKNIIVKLYCVNPAKNLQSVFDMCRSSVLFSATLLPLKYYQDLLSKEESYAVYVPSPFPKNNRIILIGTDVSTRYRNRTKDNYRKIAGYLAEMAGTQRGNYMAYFPSYSFMEEVFEAFEEIKPEGLQVVRQVQSMTELQREEFLNLFEDQNGWLLGFCVQGGIFAEGIDLTGERLIGTAVVGPGIPMVTEQTDLLKDYYDQKGLDGFDYAYKYPGLNKVLQSAGRVIRTAHDRGVILLLDDRFMQSGYKKMFPREWDDIKRCTLSTVKEELNRFWKE